MEDLLMELKGHNGQLELYKDKVIIKRKGFFAKLYFGFVKGDKTIYLNRISGIKLKECGLWMGYIQFILPGNIETTRESINGIQNDENTVTFGLCPFNRGKYNNLAKKIKLEIENRIINYSQPVIDSNSYGPDIIRKYKQLCDDGIITKEEYEAKKKKILDI
jgi:hypothetical protein